MYSSLGSVDIVYKQKDGTIVACQTDHRSAAEIQKEADYSVVFAIVRAETARRVLDTEYPKEKRRVEFSYEKKPPQKIIDLVASLGAESCVNLHTVLKPKGGRDIEKTLNAAMDSIGKKFAKDNSFEISVGGAQKADKLVLMLKPNAETDIIGYWKIVIGFAAFAALVLKKEMNGNWGIEHGIPMAVPLKFTIRDDTKKENKEFTNARIFLVAKVTKLIENGEEDSVAALLEHLIHKVHGTEGRQIVLSLKKEENEKAATTTTENQENEKKGFLDGICNRLFKKKAIKRTAP